jgi:2-oxoglutarate ferredoxin oxidoreductase subunit delta
MHYKEGHMKYWRVPLDYHEVKITKGVVHIIEDRCKGCGYCIAHCPREILEESKMYNSKGYHFPVVKAGECLNCHYCELLCPEFAIYSVAESE